MLNAICKVLGIASPSKEFASIGEFSGLGFAEGLMNSSDSVNYAAESVAMSALQRFEGVLNGYGGYNLNNLINSDPKGLAYDDAGNLIGLKKGVSGDAVVEWQKRYNQIADTKGWDKIAEDGYFGDQTEQSVYKAAELFGLHDESRYQGIITDDLIDRAYKPINMDELTSQVDAYEETVDAMVSAFTSGDAFSKLDQNAQDWLREHIENQIRSNEEAVNSFMYASEDQKEVVGRIYKGLGEELAGSDKMLTGELGVDIVKAIQVPLDSAVYNLDMNSIENFIGSGLIGAIQKGFGSDATDRILKTQFNLQRDIYDAWEVNSPSKVTMRLGQSIVEGFMMGISGDEEYAVGAMDNLCQSLMKSLGIIDPDMEIQPTITPVLDLSNVQSGVSTMNGLLGGDRSIALATNTGAISSMMNSRGQNGGNDDVVSAIKRLQSGIHDDITGMDNNVYNIKGVTYNDENAITDAVKLIVQQMIRNGRSGG